MIVLMLPPMLNLPPFLSLADVSSGDRSFAQDVYARKELVRAAGVTRHGHRHRGKNPVVGLRYGLPMMRILP
jgi:hypothetical protein